MHLKNQNINNNKVILNFGATEFGIAGVLHFYCTSTIGTFWNLEVPRGVRQMDGTARQAGARGAMGGRRTRRRREDSRCRVGGRCAGVGCSAGAGAAACSAAAIYGRVLRWFIVLHRWGAVGKRLLYWICVVPAGKLEVTCGGKRASREQPQDMRRAGRS